MVKRTQLRIAVLLSSLWGGILSWIGLTPPAHAQESPKNVASEQTASPRPAAVVGAAQIVSPRPAARVRGEQTTSPRPAARVVGEQTASPIPSAAIILRQAIPTEGNEPTTMTLEQVIKDKNELELFKNWMAEQGITPTMNEVILFRLERISERMNSLEKKLGQEN